MCHLSTSNYTYATLYNEGYRCTRSSWLDRCTTLSKDYHQLEASVANYRNQDVSVFAHLDRGVIFAARRSYNIWRVLGEKEQKDYYPHLLDNTNSLGFTALPERDVEWLNELEYPLMISSEQKLKNDLLPLKKGYTCSVLGDNRTCRIWTKPINCGEVRVSLDVKSKEMYYSRKDPASSSWSVITSGISKLTKASEVGNDFPTQTFKVDQESAKRIQEYQKVLQSLR